MKSGDIVTFYGCSQTQHNWGNHTGDLDDLIKDNQYVIERVELHSWHTKVFLENIKGSFNSICFKDPEIVKAECNEMQQILNRGFAMSLRRGDKVMNDDAFLYREEHGEIEEPQELNQEQIKTIISHATTADLVAELERREGVESAIIECDDGPAKTIVVHKFVVREDGK